MNCNIDSPSYICIHSSSFFLFLFPSLIHWLKCAGFPLQQTKAPFGLGTNLINAHRQCLCLSERQIWCNIACVFYASVKCHCELHLLIILCDWWMHRIQWICFLWIISNHRLCHCSTETVLLDIDNNNNDNGNDSNNDDYSNNNNN